MFLDRVLGTRVVQFFCKIVESIHTRVASLWAKKAMPMPSASPELFRSSLVEQQVIPRAADYLDEKDEEGQTRMIRLFQQAAQMLIRYYPNTDPLKNFIQHEAYYRSELIKRDRLWFKDTLVGETYYVDMDKPQEFLLAGGLFAIVREQIKNTQSGQQFLQSFSHCSQGS